MDRTQGINNTMHFGQPRPTISAKVSQDVKTPFQFKIAAQTQKSSAPQGSPASGGIFQRPSLSLSENLKLPENTLKRDPGTALRGSLFKFSPNHKPPATGVPVYSDMANLEKRKDIIGCTALLTFNTASFTLTSRQSTPSKRKPVVSICAFLHWGVLIYQRFSQKF